MGRANPKLPNAPPLSPVSKNRNAFTSFSSRSQSRPHTPCSVRVKPSHLELGLDNTVTRIATARSERSSFHIPATGIASNAKARIRNRSSADEEKASHSSRSS